METLINTIFRQQFDAAFGSLIVNTEDITDAEAIVFPPGDANCMNWIVGHIVDARNQLLTLFKLEPVWDNKELYYYARGSKPKQLCEHFLPFSRLIEYFRSSQERLMAGIKDFESHQLGIISAITLPDGSILSHTLLEWTTVFSFHESYHCGQTGLLRKLLGKEGKIK